MYWCFNYNKIKVLTTISDKRIPVENNGVVDYYVADINTVSDYYPFGSPMDGRTFYSEKYRFGFNGQEKDDEISGMGNYSFFKYRVSDNRLGRFFAVDPLSSKFAYNSTYAFSENRVIDGRELEGLEVFLVGVQGGANAILGAGSETGLAIAPNGLYVYETVSLSAETNASAGASLSITYFGDMPKAQDTEGWGWSVGIGGGELATLSINSASSNGYKGLNYQFGVGLGHLPIQAQGAATYTWLKPLSSLAKSESRSLLLTSRNTMYKRVKTLNSERMNLSKEILRLSNENATLKNKMSGLKGDERKKQKIN